jgi:5'-nucleotidase
LGEGLRIAPIVDTIRRYAAEARKAGAAAVVVTGHVGGRCTNLRSPQDLSSCDRDEEIMAIANRLESGTIDVFVAGHTHQGMAHTINGIAIIESFNAGTTFGRVDLHVDRATSRVIDKKIHPPREICLHEDPATHSCRPEVVKDKKLVRARYEGVAVTADHRIDAILAGAVERARRIKAEKLGVVLETPIDRVYDVESPEGNLFTDLMKAARTDADVAITNGGGLRADLPAGELTYGHIYEAMPFDNRLVVLRLPGQDLRAALRRNIMSGSGILSVSGVSVIATCDGRDLKVVLRRADGGEVRDEETIDVATNDFLALGGDGVFGAAVQRGATMIDDGRLIRDVLADQLTRGTKRLRAEMFFNPTNRRMQYPGQRPVRCQGK